MKTTIIAAALVFTFGLSVVSCVQMVAPVECYSCSDCEDTSKLENVTKKICDDGACWKKIENGETLRDCVPDGDRLEYQFYHGCKEKDVDLFSGKTRVLHCSCHNDLCNSATKQMTGTGICLLTLLSYILIN